MSAAQYHYNKLLLKQIQKKYGNFQDLPPEMMELIISISQTYDQYERERQLIERSMDLSSQEMIEANNKLEKQAEKLQRSNQELSEFAYAVSHDLKEPLRTIASYVQLIEARLRKNLDTETTEFMNYAVSGVKRLQTMLDGMLKYAQAGEEQKDFSKLNINIVLETVLENLRENITDNNAEIKLLNTLPEITGNRVQLVQLFQNLIANSIKFRSANTPVIEIKTERVKNEYFFSISDNGIGISDRDKQKFFVMFKRGHSTNYEGIGMGLSICKKIVENHGGKIWIADNAPENGVKINFTLPANHSV